MSESSRDRALYLTVASHLEQSEMLFLELVNIDPDTDADVSVERRRADELKHQNRLYRQAALNAGQRDLVALLESLELVLVELANSPDAVEASDLDTLRTRIEDGDLIFRVRIVGSRLRSDSERSADEKFDTDPVVDV